MEPKKVTFIARVEEMASSDVARIIGQDRLDKIKSKFSEPLFALFRIVHEGTAKGHIVGEGKVDKIWGRDAVRSAMNCLNPFRRENPAKVCVKHRGWSPEREGIGTVEGTLLEERMEGAEGFVLCHIADEKAQEGIRSGELDIASLEGLIKFDKNNKGELEVAQVVDIPVIALDTSKDSKPGLERAHFIEAVTCMAEEKNPDDKPKPKDKTEGGAEMTEMTLEAFLAKATNESYRNAFLAHPSVQADIATSRKPLEEARDKAKTDTEELQKKVEELTGEITTMKAASATFDFRSGVSENLSTFLKTGNNGKAFNLDEDKTKYLTSKFGIDYEPRGENADAWKANFDADVLGELKRMEEIGKLYGGSGSSQSDSDSGGNADSVKTDAGDSVTPPKDQSEVKDWGLRMLKGKVKSANEATDPANRTAATS